MPTDENRHYHYKEENQKILITEHAYEPEFEAKSGALFCQSNGYLGVRGAAALPTLYGSRGTSVAGYYHRAFPGQPKELVSGPDIAGLRIRFRRRELSPDSPSLKGFERSFCPQDAQLTSSMVFEPGEKVRLLVEERRFASFADPHLFCQYIRIVCREGSGVPLFVSAVLDAGVTNGGVCHFSEVSGSVKDRRVMQLRAVPGTGAGEDPEQAQGLPAWMVTSRTFWSCPERQADQAQSVFALKGRSLRETREYCLEAGDELELVRFTRVETDGLTEPVCEDTGGGETGLMSEEKAGESLSPLRRYLEAFGQHEECLRRLRMQGEIRIAGASTEERTVLSLAQYHLLAMVPWGRSDCSVAAKALTGEGYKGHVFWDNELFIQPYLVLFYPEQAKAALRYRCDQLDDAVRKAAAFGYDGALFPWESAADGEEQTPPTAAINIHTGKANPVWSALKEHHISADVGYAVLQYFDFTGDAEFLMKYGLEILLEVSLFWASRAVWSGQNKRYEILDVIGPDEYTEHIDNNAYTNYMAHYVMNRTLQLLEESEAWGEAERILQKRHEDPHAALLKIRSVRDGLYLPGPESNGIIPQDDTFLSKKPLENIEYYREAPVRQVVLQDYSRDQVVDMQVLKQADLVMLFSLFPDLFDRETVRKNLAFYADRTVHDSSLSYCMHACAFAQTGDMDSAEAFFRRSLSIDLNENPFESADGIHAAAMGGMLISILFGFAGLHVRGQRLCASPHLPERWKRVECTPRFRGEAVPLTIVNEEETWQR